MRIYHRHFHLCTFPRSPWADHWLCANIGPLWLAYGPGGIQLFLA
jgi:hypothetical protein